MKFPENNGRKTLEWWNEDSTVKGKDGEKNEKQNRYEQVVVIQEE